MDGVPADRGSHHQHGSLRRCWGAGKQKPNLFSSVYGHSLSLFLIHNICWDKSSCSFDLHSPVYFCFRRPWFQLRLLRRVFIWMHCMPSPQGACEWSRHRKQGVYFFPSPRQSVGEDGGGGKVSYSFTFEPSSGDISMEFNVVSDSAWYGCWRCELWFKPYFYMSFAMETPIWWPVLCLLYFGFASVYSGIISAGIIASSSYNREQDKLKSFYW